MTPPIFLPSTAVLRLRSSPWPVLFLVLLGTAMPLADTTIMNIGRFYVVRAYDLPPTEAGWLTAGFSLAVAMGIPLSRGLRGIFGERVLYTLATFAFLLGTVILLEAHGLAMAMAGRAIEGMAGGVLLPLSTAILQESFPAKRVPVALSLFALGNALAVSLGPSVGGYLIESWGWQSAFFINLPIGFLTLVLLPVLLPERPRSPSGPFDLPGFLLLCLSSGCFFTAFMSAEWFGWHSSTIETGFWVSACAFFLFLLRSSRGTAPLLPSAPLMIPAFAGLLVLGFLLSTSVFGRMYLLAPFLEKNFNIRPYVAGEVIAVGALSEILIAFLALGRIPPATDFRKVLLAGSLLLALANFSGMRFPAGTYSASLILSSQILFGFGLALSQFSLARLAATILPPSLFAQGLVYQQMVLFLGGMWGAMGARHLLANMAPVFSLSLPQTSAPAGRTPDRTLAAIANAYATNLAFEWLGFLALIAALALLLVMLLAPLYRKEQRQ